MKKFFILISFCIGVIACQKPQVEEVFSKSSTQRINQVKQELIDELIAAPRGWKLTYQPNPSKFGGFTFLMKFDANGNVEMTSDAPGDVALVRSLYEVQNLQTVTLSFTTRNHIHRLSNPDSRDRNLRGTSYNGEFDFLYFGKEGDKLKFRTQRDTKGGFVYFEKADEVDWRNIQVLEELANDLATESFRHYLRVIDTEGTHTDYRMEINPYRYVVIKNFKDSEDSHSFGFTPTSKGLVINPPLKVKGKAFDFLPWDRELQKYSQTIDGVTAQINFSLRKLEEHISDDYQDVPQLESFITVFSTLLNTSLTSDTFKQISTLPNETNFSQLRIDFDHSRKLCQIQLRYSASGSNKILATSCSYKLEDKRLKLTVIRAGLSNDLSFWQAPENQEITRRALTILGVFGINQGDERSFFIDRRTERIQFPNTIYLLQSEQNQNFYFPAYAL